MTGNMDKQDKANGNVPTMKPLSPLVSPRLINNRSGVNHQRTIDEMRARIARLKADLEIEKARNKQLHRDKIIEIRQVRDTCEQEKDQAVEQLQLKLEREKELEVLKVKEAIVKEKDQEIRTLVRRHNEEIWQLKAQWAEEKDDAIRKAVETHHRAQLGDEQPDSAELRTRPGSANPTLLVRLQREVHLLRESNKELEGQIKVKIEAAKEKAAEMRKMQADHDAEIEEIIEQSKVEVAKHLDEIQAEREALKV